MLGVEAPWPHLDGVKAAVAAAIKTERPPIPRHWDGTLVDLIRAMWANEPRQRPSFAAILEQLHAIHVSQIGCTLEEAIKRGAGGGGAGAPAGGCCTLL